MKLSTTCHACQHKIQTSTMANDRVELAMNKGEEIELTCKNCNKSDKYHVDFLYASENKLAHLVALVFLLLEIPLLIWLLWDYWLDITWVYALASVGGVILAPIVVFGMIKKNDQDRVNAFNLHKLKR